MTSPADSGRMIMTLQESLVHLGRMIVDVSLEYCAL